MYSDIVIPSTNEAEFIEVAKRLNIKKLYFLYNFDNYQNQKSSIFDFDIEIGFIVNQKNINKALELSKLIIVKSSDKDRAFIESKKVRVIYGFEEVHKNDYLHQRASGLNHVICEIAKKNNVIIGLSYSSLLNKNTPISSLIMGRMIQNIKLCQKYNVKTIISSFSEKPFDLRPPHDVKSLFTMLGMNSNLIKNRIC